MQLALKKQACGGSYVPSNLVTSTGRDVVRILWKLFPWQSGGWEDESQGLKLSWYPGIDELYRGQPWHLRVGPTMGLLFGCLHPGKGLQDGDWMSQCVCLLYSEHAAVLMSRLPPHHDSSFLF